VHLLERLLEASKGLGAAKTPEIAAVATSKDEKNILKVPERMNNL
jgi:hypothetical protein